MQQLDGEKVTRKSTSLGAGPECIASLLRRPGGRDHSSLVYISGVYSNCVLRVLALRASI